MTLKAAECEDINQEDPFEISTRSALSFRIMEEAGLLSSVRKKELERMNVTAARNAREYEAGTNVLPGWSRQERLQAEKIKLYIRRLIMGVLGGLAIIVPMLIMVLHNSLPTTLATTSLATLLFAIVLARSGQPKEPEGVLAATATYAAVLVVFVGATT